MKTHSTAQIVAVLSILAFANLSAAESEKPNFVFINIDDLGYADVGPFGSELNRTPHLDRMAVEGRRLTSFYRHRCARHRARH